MSSSAQGVRSSRTDPITPEERRRMRGLDSIISKLDWAIRINVIINPNLAERQRKSRDFWDQERKALRTWMKFHARP